MRLSTLASFATLATLVLGAPPSGRSKMPPRQRDQGVPLGLLAKRDCGEGFQRVCYGPDSGTSQNLDPEDIQYVASYLRFQADGKETSPIWNMPSEFQCSEWSIEIPGTGTVLALVKHINPRTNSGLSFNDLARTIDGRPDATDEQRAKSLWGGCKTNGGQLGVIVDLKDPAYNTTDYIAKKMKPADLIVKLVRAKSPK